MKKGSLLLMLALVVGMIIPISVNGTAVTPNWVVCDYTTKVEAPAGFIDGDASTPMAKFCTVKDGALVMDTNSQPEAGPTYRLPLDVKAGFKMTVVVKAKAIAALGMDIDFRAGLRERMILKDNAIEFNTSKVSDATIKTTDWHTYFITYEMTDKLVTKLYVDGMTAPLLTATSSTADSSSYFRFGDGSGSKPYAGAIDWIVWTFDGAFSPDQVNLPAGLALK